MYAEPLSSANEECGEIEVQQLRCTGNLMVEAAESGNWAEVEDLQNRRHALIVELLDSASGLDDTVRTSLIQQLLNENRLLTGLARESQDALAQQLLTMQLGKTAQKAYQSVSTADN